MRNLATPLVLSRLAQIGVRFWDSPGSARARLDELTDLIARHGAEGRGMAAPAVRKAYEEAWQQISDQADLPQRVLISRQSQLEVTDLHADGEPVYVSEEGGAAKERLLRQTPVAMLAIRSARLADRVRRLLLRAGPNRLVPTSETSVEITADGMPADELPFQRLDDVSGRWLRILVLGCLEFHHGSFVTISSRQLTDADRKLARCEIATASSVEAHIGSHRISADESGTQSLTADGSMDFKRIGHADVIAWLHAHQQRPESMPQTTAPGPLRLSERDLELARERLENQSVREHRRSVTTTYGSKVFGQEPDETQAFIDAVRASVPAAFLETSPKPVSLPLAPTNAKRPGGGHGPLGWHVTTAPPEVTARVGLAGELLVGEWIHRHFNQPPEVTWVSGNRSTRFSDHKANDALGFDFLVALDDVRLLVEVKATKDALPQFTLGESEVRRAQDLRPDEQYLIAFVTHALEPDLCQLYILPNPFEPGGFTRYEIAGRSLRLLFQFPSPAQ